MWLFELQISWSDSIMDPSERKGRILGENKGFFHSFIPTSALFPNGINYGFISEKCNLFRLVCYANNLWNLCSETLDMVQSFLSLSTTKINLCFFKRVSKREEMVILFKCLYWRWFRCWMALMDVILSIYFVFVLCSYLQQFFSLKSNQITVAKVYNML